MSVTLAELKDHLRITWDDEDSSLSVYLAGALDYVETFTGQKLSRIARNSYFDDFSNLELVGDSPQAFLSVMLTMMVQTRLYQAPCMPSKLTRQGLTLHWHIISHGRAIESKMR